MTNPIHDTELYAVACPHWCNQLHAPLLCAEDDPVQDVGLNVAEPIVSHEAELASSPEGFAVSIAHDQSHPTMNLPDIGPRCVVSIPEKHWEHGVSSATLRQWADTMSRAAALAEELGA